MELLESRQAGDQEINFRPLPASGPVEKTSPDTQRIIKTALIVGGTLAASWFIFRLIRSSSKKKNKTTDAVAPVPAVEAAPIQEAAPASGDILSAIGDRVAKEATIFLLNLAREKIEAWLASKRTADEQHP